MMDITIRTTKELIQYKDILHILTLNNRLVIALNNTDKAYILIDIIKNIEITNVRPNPMYI